MKYKKMYEGHEEHFLAQNNSYFAVGAYAMKMVH